MHNYRCYFLQGDGVAAVWRAFHGESDEEAHDRALGLFVGYQQADKVEVWEGPRLTLIYTRSASRTPTELRRLCYLSIAAADKEFDPKIRQAIASHASVLAQEAEALERQTISQFQTDTTKT